MAPFERIIWIVLDSLGIGAQPDAASWGDAGRDTLGHIAERRGLSLPNLRRLGLANIRRSARLTPAAHPKAPTAKATLLSPGKDTTTGHWEMAGIWLRAFPTYPHGFPPDLMDRLSSDRPPNSGNFPASGTEIIKELGEEHMRTGSPSSTPPAIACSRSPLTKK